MQLATSSMTGEHRPEELLDEIGVSMLVGVRQCIARRDGYAEAGENRRFETKPVANVIEANGVGKLGEEHRSQVTADTEGPGFCINPGFPGVPVDKTARNQVEQLLNNDNIGSGWCFFGHTPLPSGRDSEGRQPTFASISYAPVGWLCKGSAYSSARPGISAKSALGTRPAWWARQ